MIGRLALHNIMVHKGRFCQSTMSFVVGIAGVIVLLSLSAGLTRQMEALNDAYSDSLVFVDVYMRLDANLNFTVEDMETLLPGAKGELYTAFSPMVWIHSRSSNGDRVYEPKLYEDGSPVPAAVGVSEEFIDTMGIQITAGRWLQAMDIRRAQKVCVLGEELAADLLVGEPLGQSVRLQGENFTVVGVFNVPDAYDETENPNYLMLVPYTAGQKVAGDDIISLYDGNNYYRHSFYVDAGSMDNIGPLCRALWDNFKADARLSRSGTIYVVSFEQLEEWDKNEIYATSGNLMMLAGLVLLVGGMGVMNVMSAMVNERRAEIGVRRAFGARRGDIKRQFLLEAACTTLLGGLLGVALGIPFSYAACDCVDLPVRFISPPWGAIWVVLLVAVCFGLVFGTYPATEAAELEPVDALR